MPLTSFRFQLAMDTLVSLAGQFPLLEPVRDLHPLADIHASQNIKRINGPRPFIRSLLHVIAFITNPQKEY